MKTALDWRRVPGLGTYTALILVFLYAPLAVLVVYSFNAGSLVTVWAGFSLKWFGVVAANGDIQEATLHSLAVASSATVFSTLLALFGAIGLERTSSRLAAPLSALFTLPLLVPEIVTAVTTLVFFADVRLRLGIGNLIVAHTVFCTAFAMMPIRARIRSMGDQWENAARDLYAPPIKVFLRVTLPLLGPGIVSGAMLAFVASLDDFLLSAMVGDAGTTTLPVYVYGMIRRGITPEVNAASTILLVASFVLAGFAQYLNRPRGHA